MCRARDGYGSSGALSQRPTSPNAAVSPRGRASWVSPQCQRASWKRAFLGRGSLARVVAVVVVGGGCGIGLGFEGFVMG